MRLNTNSEATGAFVPSDTSTVRPAATLGLFRVCVDLTFR
jgi:hypothetical protein